MKKHRFLLIAAASVMLLLLIFPAQAKSAAADALRMCGVTLIPSLFPFYAAADLFLAAGLPPAGKQLDAVMRRLFGLPGEAAPALMLGLLGGYPIGASVTAGLYRQGVLTKQEAVTLSRFSNNSGPAFIIGAAGLAVFQSVKLGLLLYAIHAVSAVITGILLREKADFHLRTRRLVQTQSGSITQALPEAISAAAQSMLMICAYVVFFSVVLAVLRAISPIKHLFSALSLRFPVSEAVLSGAAELSCGILALQGAPRFPALVTASVLLGWGGICVFFQSASVLSAAGLPAKQCVKGKLTQALVAGALSCVFCAAASHSGSFFLGFTVFLLFSLGICKIRGRKATPRLI